MAELVQSQTGSSSTVVQQQQQQQEISSNSSAAFSFSSSSSLSASSTSSSSSSSSSSKVIKQSMSTSTKQSSASSSTSSSSSTMMMSSSSSSLKSVSIQSSSGSYSDRLAVDLGIADASKEMERLQLRLTDEMTNIHRDMFRLMPDTPPQSSSVASPLDQFLVKMDDDAIKSCIDKAHDDKVKLNFDVNEFDSETINIQTVGNKIEIHAKKKSKKGDEERSEEFSRVYELPNELDSSHVTSSIYKDGVLTIELPVSDALGPPK